MAPKANLKKFMACNKCKSTLLEKRKFFRMSLDEWTHGAVPHHEVETHWCFTCNLPVLATIPRDLVGKAMLQELVTSETKLSSLIAEEVEVDLSVMVSPATRSLGQRRELAGLPPIDPNKPLVK